MKTVYLHIGLHKTGTSTIQFFLAKNREKLKSLGYLYPFKTAAHHNLAFLVSDIKKAQKENNNWENLFDEIENFEGENIIISSEAFSRSSNLGASMISETRKKLKNFQTKIIVYLRRNDLRMESQFVQILKSGKKIKSIEDYCHEHRNNYLDFIESWAKEFGEDNIIVRPLEKSEIPDLTTDFLKCIKIKNSIDFFDKTEHRNIKPGLEQIIALKFIIDWLNKDKKNGRKNNSLQMDFSKNLRNPFFNFTSHWETTDKYRLIPFALSENILEESQKENQTIASKYIKDKQSLFNEPLEPYQNVDLNINRLKNEYYLDVLRFLEQNFNLGFDKKSRTK